MRDRAVIQPSKSNPPALNVSHMVDLRGRNRVFRRLTWCAQLLCRLFVFFKTKTINRCQFSVTDLKTKNKKRNSASKNLSAQPTRPPPSNICFRMIHLVENPPSPPKKCTSSFACKLHRRRRILSGNVQNRGCRATTKEKKSRR